MATGEGYCTKGITVALVHNPRVREVGWEKFNPKVALGLARVGPRGAQAVLRSHVLLSVYPAYSIGTIDCSKRV